MNESFAEERRMFERYPATAPIILNAGSFVSSGFLLDISKEGVGLKCNSRFPEQLRIGAQVELIIKDQNNGRHRKASVLDAEICWVDKETRRKAGLSFINGTEMKSKNDFADFMPKDKKEEKLLDTREKISDSDDSLIEVSEILFGVCGQIDSIIGNKDNLSTFSEDPKLVQAKMAISSLRGDLQKELADTLLILSRQIKERIQLLADEIMHSKKNAKEKSDIIENLKKELSFFKLIMLANLHDINNINTIIVGHASILMDDQIKDSGASNSILDLLNAGNRITDITRMGQKLCYNSLVVDPAEIEVESLFAESQFARRDTDFKNQINFEMMPDSNIKSFLAHKNPLKEAISQIIQNARRYSQDNGTIRIGFNEVQKDDKRLIKITIADEGGGIPEENLEKVFEPKFTTKKDGKGGFGLYFAQNLIKIIGGNIVAENIANENGTKGAKFSIYLPVQNSKSSQEN